MPRLAPYLFASLRGMHWSLWRLGAKVALGNRCLRATSAGLSARESLTGARLAATALFANMSISQLPPSTSVSPWWRKARLWGFCIFGTTWTLTAIQTPTRRLENHKSAWLLRRQVRSSSAGNTTGSIHSRLAHWLVQSPLYARILGERAAARQT
jgi:hypothetical protein